MGRLRAALGLLLAAGVLSLSPTMADQVGVWQFNNSLNNDQPGGDPMSVVGVWTPTYVNQSIGGSSATALSFPKFTATQALGMPNQAGVNGPNGPGSPPTTNNWSIVMDVRFPSAGDYTSLWETGEIGGNDADYFVRGLDGIGTSGQYGGTYTPSDWTRIAVTVDSMVDPLAYTVTGYINGVATGVVATTGTAPGGKEAIAEFLHLFNDDTPGFAETSAGQVNSVAYYGEVLTPAAILALGGATAAGIPVAAPGAQVGVWNFNDSLDNAHSGGAPMSVVGGWAPSYVDAAIGGSTARVLSFPAMNTDQALDMPNEAGPDDPGVPPGLPTTTNIWSIVMDVKFTAVGNYTALWDTVLGSDDADYFVRDTEGIGTSGQYGGTYTPSDWTRIAVTVDSPVGGGGYKVNGYIDGVWNLVEATTSTTPDGKEAIAAILHLFADGDGETSAGLVNSIAFYDEVLTMEAIAALGGATAAGIPAVVPPGVPGDYNGNHVVDAADYTKWRDNLGATIALPNDGVTPGMVTQEDYSFWKTHFGNSGAGSGAGFGAAGVPEPAGSCLAILALLGGAAMRRGR